VGLPPKLWLADHFSKKILGRFGMIYTSSDKRRKVCYRRLPKREIFARENEPQARVKKGRIGYKFLSEFKDPTGQPN
jgi:hypothetical protein